MVCIFVTAIVKYEAHIVVVVWYLVRYNLNTAIEVVGCYTYGFRLLYFFCGNS